MNRNIIGKIGIIALSTAFFGQVYVNPFNTDFRISIGVVVMALLLLKFKNTPIVITLFITGITVVAFRMLIGYLSGESLGVLYQIHMPTFFFYMTYGLLMKIFSVRETVNQPILLITFIGFADIFSNVIEAAARYEFVNVTAEIVLPSLFLIGFLRAFIIFTLNLGLMFYTIIILKDENNEKIKEFLVLASKMKTESFFLEKSMNDIEQAMNKSYCLYNEMMSLDASEITDGHVVEFRLEILELSKDIHEVKKDNERVIAGIKKLIPDTVHMEEMKFDEIVVMLMENTENLAKMQGKNIFIKNHIVYKNMTIKNYYPMITILINLLSNAVDAIEDNGAIVLEQHLDKEYLVVDIIDNGTGIRDDLRDIIFEPGYSSKFDAKTGQMSSGIGLTHVKTLIENYYDGSIELVNRPEENTRFRLSFKKEKLVEVLA
jgi:two-component system sensor histidine kinase YcbA